jgi:hypothetical protein
VLISPTTLESLLLRGRLGKASPTAVAFRI